METSTAILVVLAILVLLLAVPILIQVHFNSGLTYLLMRWLQVPHSVASPGGSAPGDRRCGSAERPPHTCPFRKDA